MAKTVGMSPAHLARLEASKRGLYVDDFVRIAEALGEKPGNLLPNDLGHIGHLKPFIDRLIAVRPELLPRLTTILEEMILLTEPAGAAVLAPVKPRARVGRRSTAEKEKRR